MYAPKYPTQNWERVVRRIQSNPKAKLTNIEFVFEDRPFAGLIYHIYRITARIEVLMQRFRIGRFGGWPTSQFSFLKKDEGAPYLDFEIWVSAESESLLMLVHHDSISTAPMAPVE